VAATPVACSTLPQTAWEREKPWVVETRWLTGGLRRFEIPTNLNPNLIKTWFVPKLTFSCLKILSKIPGDSF
jgi:hypothetical protein